MRKPVWHFRAAPFGDRTGIFSSSMGELSLRVVVLPKFWASGDGRSEYLWDDDSHQLEIEVCETQAFSIRAQNLEQSELLAKVSKTLHERASIQRLLTESSAGRQAATNTQPIDDRRQLALVTLGLRLGLMEISSSRHGSPRAGLGSDIDRLIVFDSFLRLVESMPENLKFGYVRATARMPQVKGRPNALDLGLFSAGAATAVRTTFLRLSGETPLNQFNASVLRSIEGECARHPDRQVFSSVRQRAAGLLHYWPSSSLPREDALQLVPSLQTGDVTELKEELLSVGRLILEGHSSLRQSEPGDLAWFEGTIDMARLWERLVRQQIRNIGAKEVIDGNAVGSKSVVRAPAPWTHLSAGQRRPDLAFRFDGEWHLGDAKYKQLTRGMPEAGDVNQMFLYSQLATVNRKDPVEVDLFYPSRSASDSNTYPGITKRIPPLTIHEMDFPSPEDVLNQASEQAWT